MTTRRSVMRAIGGAATLGVARAFAQDDKSTVTVLVGAGSTMEATARLISEYLRDALGRPVITISKLGAGGRVALGELRRAAPDGRTLMFSTSSPFTIYPNVYLKLDYDPATDFTPITGVSAFDIGLATGPGTTATDLKGVVAWAKSKGSEALYGAAPGNGSASHFTGIGLALAANLTLNMVPYKDSAVGIGDAITGRLPLLITGTGAMGEMHKAGKLRIVATSGTERTPLVSGVPTFKESGLDVVVVNMTGLFGPPKLPAEIVARLNGAVQQMLQRADMRDKLLMMAMTPLPMTPPQFSAALADDRKHFAHLVKASGYQPEAAS
jgi:tripartite-type tricarboxylate transporter receptor subunit TctC